MKKQITELVYQTILKEPAKSDYLLAKQLGLKRGTIWNTRKRFTRTLDYKLAQEVAGLFLADFAMASEFFKLKITDTNESIEKLETLKNGKKTVFRKNDKGDYYPVEVDLEAKDVMEIDKQILEREKFQAQLWKDVVFLCRQSEAVEVIKMIQNGRIQLPAI